jgi:hypothetical protein
MISYSDDKTPILLDHNISNHRNAVDDTILNKCSCKNGPVTNEPTITRIEVICCPCPKNDCVECCKPVDCDCKKGECNIEKCDDKECCKPVECHSVAIWDVLFCGLRKKMEQQKEAPVNAET